VDLLGCSRDEIILASGKEGIGIEDILMAIAERVPAPKGSVDAPLQAMIFDSVYNSFRGVEVLFRISTEPSEKVIK
jgi:GTP-binding protein LepA